MNISTPKSLIILVTLAMLASQNCKCLDWKFHSTVKSLNPTKDEYVQFVQEWKCQFGSSFDSSSI